MEDKAAYIIRRTLYAAVATSTVAGEPWNSPVYVVYDDRLIFYWASSRSSQHSLNISTNARVFLAIYDSSTPWGEGEGVFIQAEAAEVNDSTEVARACGLREARAVGATQPAEDFGGGHLRRIYKATPKKIWVNQGRTVNGAFVDERIEISIRALTTAMTKS
ncbi:MAG: pyridoxamine 5-phosphate oxidase family protein [Patescibacteria group bacterium]|nr:pyridoxamine 5-phosphate oxidase family protein [Patescibacteria group bacterium]